MEVVSINVTTGEGHQELALVTEGMIEVQTIARSALVRVRFPSFLKFGGLISHLIVPITKYYHIKYGVIQGFPAPRKTVTTHVMKYVFFSREFDIANQLLTRHSPFAPLGQVIE